LLDSIIIRLLETKQELVFYYDLEYEDEFGKVVGNCVSIKSDYVELDDVIVDLKMIPESLEVPIPRYFRELSPTRMDIRN